MKKLNILFITPSFIYPTIGGDRIKPYKLIEHLSKSHNVTLLCAGIENNVSDKRIAHFNKIGVKATYYKFNKYFSATKAILMTLVRHPIEAEFFNSRNFDKLIRDTVQNEKIDIIINYFERTAEAIKNIDIPKILMLDDSRCLYQKRTFTHKLSLIQSVKRYYEYKKLLKYESEICNYFDITTFVTDIDLEFTKSLNPKAKYSIVSNGVDTNIFIPRIDERKDIYFIGKLDVWVNLLMIDIILKKIYPGIKEALPDTKLYIVGANPSPDLYNNLIDGAEIIQNPESVAEYYAKARVFIHPQFAGSGIQNKILEAIACACPIVSTSIGTQGINIENGVNGFVSDNIEQLIEYSIRLLEDTTLAENISRNARKLAVEHYTWDNVFLAIDKCIDGLLNKLDN